MVRVGGYADFLETEPNHLALMILRIHTWSRMVGADDTRLSLTLNGATWDMKKSTTELGQWDMTKTIDGEIVGHWRFKSDKTMREYRKHGPT